MILPAVISFEKNFSLFLKLHLLESKVQLVGEECVERGEEGVAVGGV